MVKSENLTDIYSDLFDLDLLKDSSVKDIDEPTILRAVTITRHIGDSRPPKEVTMRTSFGRMVYETMQTGVEFGAHPLITEGKYHVCGDAEKYFARTITPESKDNGAPPIVVTYKDRPMAIIKGLGEATAYVLRNSSSHGLIKKTIALPGRHIDPQFLPRDVPAHRVELSRIGVFAAARFALTALPATTIAAAQTDRHRAGKSFEHTAMLKHAENLAKLARPVLGRELSEVILDTADYYELEL